MAGATLAPGASSALIPAGESFIDQHAAETFAAARQNAKLAAIGVFVTVDALQGEWSCIDELKHPLGRGIAQSLFLGAAGRVGFGGVDVGDADLGALIVEGVAIHDAVGARALTADAERGAFGVAAGGGVGRRCARASTHPRSRCAEH